MSNVVPDGWSVGRVGDAITSADGGVSVNSENRIKNHHEHGILKTSSVFDGRFIPSEHKAILSNEVHRASTSPKKNHILFSRMNTPVLVGQSGYVDRDYSDLFLPDRLWQIQVSDEYNAKWLSYTLRSQGVVKKISDAATGTSNSMKNIAKPNLMAIPMLCPPLPEQQKIAAILSSVDDVIEKTQAQIDKLKDLKTGMMQELLTKGIGHTEFKDSPVGRIPVGWGASTISRSCKIKNTLRKPISKEEREGMKGVYPYYGPTKAVDHINEFRVEGDHTLIGEDGDHFIKFASWAMTQFVSGKFNVNNHAHIIEGTGACRTKWIYYYFMHRDITASLTRQGATRYKLNKATLEGLELALPPAEEQDKIIEILDAVMTDITVREDKVSKLQSMKKALMQDLLTGTVRVNVDNQHKEEVVA